MADIKLLHGDCKEAKSFDDGHFDWVFSDPPYGIKESSKNHESRNTPVIQKNGRAVKMKKVDYGNSDWDNKIPDDETFEIIRAKGKNHLFFGANYLPAVVGTTFKPLRRNEYETFIEANPTNWIIWDKVNGSNDFSDCEMIWVSKPIKSKVSLLHVGRNDAGCQYYKWNNHAGK